MTVETIDMTPTWQFAARIHIAVLQNPDASYEATQGAEEELLRLAKYVDSLPNTPEQWGKAGESIAAELKLKTMKGSKRYDLHNGDKTAEGLARTIFRAIQER